MFARRAHTTSLFSHSVVRRVLPFIKNRVRLMQMRRYVQVSEGENLQPCTYTSALNSMKYSNKLVKKDI